uniref:Protein encore n=2 Tax=Lutzomyia longipalpis TaxID=7200 RepID=A0A1B0CE47_LUTLO
MNSASTQIAVAPTTQTTSPALPSPSPGPISHKDFHEEPLPRQNSLGASGNRHRGGGAKGKHLTRSHAMRESTSPPRTPTPRSDLLTSTASSPMTSCGVPVNTVSVSQAYADTTPATSSDSRLQVQSSATSTSPTSGSPSSPNVLDTPSVIVTQQSQQQQQQQSQTSPPIIFSTDDGGRSQLDVDFPKLTPPKSKSPRNTGGGGDKSNVGQQTSPKVPQSNHATSNSGTNTETIAIPNHHHHHHRHQHQNTSPGNVSPCSQHSSNGGTVINVVDTSPIPSPQGGQHGYEKEGRMREGHCNYDGESGESPSDGPTSGRGMSDRGGKKHRNGPGAKGTKPRLKAMGSSSSAEGSGASGNGGCAGGDNLAEQYTDQSGVDLIQFFKETLNKNIKDRTMLLRIEKELLALVYDRTRSQTKFPPTSSYNRMLIHRTAAYFGMDHNVDATQTRLSLDVAGVVSAYACDTLTVFTGTPHEVIGEDAVLVSKSDRGVGVRGGKKHRNGPGAKGTKPRLKAMGSSSSAEGSGASGNGGCAGGDNLAEQYTDQSGVDLIQFFKETLNKNIKDRTMLLRIEKELLALVYDRTRSQTKFPPTSSYNRMLIHRTAAYFGMDHNVDATQTCIRFETLIREMDEPRKSILKRDSHSFDEYRQGLLPCPDRGMLDRKSKSFEEREEEYERARRRIFKDRDCGGADCSVEEQHWPWSSSESSENSGRHKMAQNNRLLKVQSLSVDTRGDGRPCVSKSHSFGGYGGPMQSSGPPGHQLSRGDSVTSTKSAGPRLFPKQDSVGSTNTPWRCSPSSSGYKTQTQSLRSDSITPSPTGYGSGDHTPEPQSVLPSPAARGVVWAVTDMASVPRGSVLIDPQTLQPIVNQDGSLYLFDPSNLPPGNLHNNNNNNIMIKPPTHVPRNKKYDKTKSSMRNNDICDGNENNNSLTHSVIMENQTASSSTEDLTSPQIDEEEAHGRQSESPMQLHHQAAENTKISPQKMQKSQATSPNIPTQEIILQSGGLNEIPSIATNQSTSATPASTAVAVNCEAAYLTTNASSTTTNAVTTSPAAESAVIPSTTVTNAIITTTFTTTSGTQSATNHPHQPSSTSQTNATHSSNNVQDTAKVHHQHPRQEDGAQLAKSSVMPSVIPVMGYTTTTGYPAMENGAIFPAPNAPYPTYQQGPDGSVYAVPPMVYAYPPPMESEMSGYFLPMYDQAGTPRDSGLMPAPTPTAALYQPAAAAAAATVVPMTPYAPTAYSSGPLYTQGQVVYTAATDQFGSPAAAAAATPQYPIPAYPTMTYPYPTYNGTTTYQGYWGQPMATTYYVPQPQLLPHPASTANGTAGGGSKRGSPPQNVPQQTHGSNPSTPQTTTFNNPFGSTGVPIAAAAGDPGTMYALPQPVYPNMLPYASPATVPVSATAAVSHLPHHPHSHHAATDGVKIRYGVMSTTQQQQPTQQTHSNQMHNNTTDPAQSSYNAQTSGTPQSTPSTPLSLPLPLPTGHMAAKGGPPIFPTPPIMTNGFGPQFPGGGGAPTTAGENGYGGAGGQYERKNHTNGSGGPQQQQQQQHSSQPNRNRNGALGPRQQQTSYSGGVVGMTQSAGGASGHPVKKNLSHDNTPNVGRPTNPGGAFQKGRSDGGGASVGGKPMGGGGGHMGPPGGNVVAQPGDKGPAARGPRPKPANLDLRRSNSQRNTPSTNSTESNNSPNSIASSEQQPVYMARGTHNPPLAHHHPATAMGIDPAACHQPLIGAAYNPAAGMYPTMGLASSRRSPPSDVRPPPLTPIAPGMYPMNMMLPAPRHLGPRPAHSGGYKGNKGGHPPSGVAASGGPR